MAEPESRNSPPHPTISPDELTKCFRGLGLREGDRIAMHASLSSIGTVDGGAAMVIHRLMNVLGKNGLLLMPTFTSITRHSSTHDRFTKAGCWCEGKESRHLPFIPELQPDREMGEIAYRLCSWPASRRSRHPAFSFAAVGRESDALMCTYSQTDPLDPLKTIVKHEAFVLTIGLELDSVTAIHLAEQRRSPTKFATERALTMGRTGPLWVDIVAPGCSAGFRKVGDNIDPKNVQHANIGSARATLYRMNQLVTTAEELLTDDPSVLDCGRAECLSCRARMRGFGRAN